MSSKAYTRSYRFLIILGVILGAFLLFQIQPIVAKVLLPRFGGASSVWITCTVFFQCALFLGYLAIEKLLRNRSSLQQMGVYTALLLISSLFLPLRHFHGESLLVETEPTISILLSLAGSIGLPFITLAMTSTLLQDRFFAVFEREPHRLYAASNLASFGALLTYPFVIEPYLDLDAQRAVWDLLLGVLALTSLALFLLDRVVPSPKGALSSLLVRPEIRGSHDEFFWLAGSAAGVLLLLTTTHHLCADIAPVPLLWVIPLALYLATYSAAFGLGRPPNSPTLLVVYVTALTVFFSPFLTTSPLSPGVGLLIAMTAGCLVCHIELVRSRPAPEKLPRFYRCLALGGALGGLFAGVAAPVVFNQTFELALALITPPLIHRWSKDRNSPNRSMRYAPVAIFSAALLALIVYDHIEQRSGSTTTSFTRNFYGVLKVVERNTERPPYREFSHGSTVHGIQRLDPPHLLSPGTYYGPSSGIGRAIKSFNDRPIVVGAIGLGVGTVAVYAKPGDHYYFFELNPAVIPIAREKFSFLSQSQGTIELSLGDGRLAIERWSGQPFDILFLDAFSGDSIPTHLLTEEALASFEKKLSPEGVLIVHISNRYVDLQPVLGTVADKLGLHAALFEDPGSPTDLQWPSQHVLLTRSAKILTHPELRSAGTSIRTRTPLWTDNYSSVWRVFKSPL